MQQSPLTMTSKEVLRKYDIVKGMNEIVKSMNNEDAYMTWIYIVPDEASDEDLMDISYDEELFSDTVEYFKTIMKEFMADGLYVCGKLY